MATSAFAREFWPILKSASRVSKRARESSYLLQFVAVTPRNVPARKTQENMMLAFTKLAMAAIAATLPLVANAASEETHSISVRTDDINLNTKRGQKILALRIDRAAREVCDFANDQLDNRVRKIEQTCRTRTKASAWAMVKSDRRFGAR
jgi:UrcA family protein